MNKDIQVTSLFVTKLFIIYLNRTDIFVIRSANSITVPTAGQIYVTLMDIFVNSPKSIVIKQYFLIM